MVEHMVCPGGVSNVTRVVLERKSPKSPQNIRSQLFGTKIVTLFRLKGKWFFYRRNKAGFEFYNCLIFRNHMETSGMRATIYTAEPNVLRPLRFAGCIFPVSR